MAEPISGRKLGWSQYELDRTFDAPDDHGPSRHWQNPLGEPLYARERVRIARARRTRAGVNKLTAEEIARWNQAGQPTCRPVFTFNFNLLADAHLPGIRDQLWSERLSHPVAGRFPGSDRREFDLLVKALITLISVAEKEALQNWPQARELLYARAAGASERLGPPWPNVVLRSAHRSSYVSRASGPKMLASALDALALVATGVVKPAGWRAERISVPGLLMGMPKLRFDPVMVPSSPNGYPRAVKPLA